MLRGLFFLEKSMNQKHIIKSLPLLASVLGRKYGVQVRIGGDNAFTNGNVIQLPSLPLDCDETLLGLVRGLIDHESAHIRDTDFDALRAANLTPLEKHIWNTIEDWRAENVLSAVYPGCRENFQWLIKHFFLPKLTKRRRKEHSSDPAMLILEWLLITVRSWDVAELNEERDYLRASAEIHYPGLTHEIEPYLRLIPKNCASTLEAFGFACEIANIIRKYARFMEQQQSQPGQGTSNSSQGASSDPSGQTDTQTDPVQALQSLQKILSADADGGMFPGDIGDKLKEAITDACGQQGEHIQVAVVTRKPTGQLAQDDLDNSRQSTTALRTRLQALMQSTRSVRNHSGYVGALNIRKLHSLATGNAKVFLRKGERVGVNTAVHILIDSSGSMNCKEMQLASQACFAVASALQGIKGISVGVTTFPGERGVYEGSQQAHWQTVTPILRHHEKMHTRFAMSGAGNTPLDSALWWTMQQLHPMPESRKMILIITDGQPDNSQLAQTAITEARKLGLEVYGIGIANASILSLLPDTSSVINSIAELAPSMFGMLQRALIAGHPAA